jgi:transcriptional regulator of arginine metabolism
MHYDEAIEGHIIDIVSNHSIAEQSELQENLALRGYEIPQATLSRRLKKLKIVKIDGFYKMIDFPHYNLPMVLNLQISEFGLIVMHTHPGQANALAYFIDNKYVSFSANEKNDLGILGSIAGDDTVLLVIKNKKKLEAILEKLYDEFPYLQKK